MGCITLAFDALAGADEAGAGFESVFQAVRDRSRPGAVELERAVSKLPNGAACRTRAAAICTNPFADKWPLAYALSWISVAGNESVMPPWVKHRFQRAAELVRELRDSACTDLHCTWRRERTTRICCSSGGSAARDFRREPAGRNGEPLQREIVAKGLAGERGLVVPGGRLRFERYLRGRLLEGEVELSPVSRALFTTLIDEYATIDTRIGEIDQELGALPDRTRSARRSCRSPASA